MINIIIGLGILFFIWDIQKLIKKLHKYLDIQLSLLEPSINSDK